MQTDKPLYTIKEVSLIRFYSLLLGSVLIFLFNAINNNMQFNYQINTCSNSTFRQQEEITKAFCSLTDAGFVVKLK